MYEVVAAKNIRTNMVEKESQAQLMVNFIAMFINIRVVKRANGQYAWLLVVLILIFHIVVKNETQTIFWRMKETKMWQKH